MSFIDWTYFSKASRKFELTTSGNSRRLDGQDSTLTHTRNDKAVHKSPALFPMQLLLIPTRDT